MAALPALPLKTIECGCKAPAALCYKAPDLDTLRALLAETPVGEDALANIAAAQEFVQSYLYNVDGVIAAAFINYEVKARFALKAADLRPLLALHKELYKAHRDSKEARCEAEELPDWYEPTERGGLKFLPAVLAEHMAENVDAFYSAEQYFVYHDGVYTAVPDLGARRMTRSFMNPRYTLMSNITDAEGQWRMLCMRPLREINSNPLCGQCAQRPVQRPRRHIRAAFPGVPFDGAAERALFPRRTVPALYAVPRGIPGRGRNPPRTGDAGVFPDPRQQGAKVLRHCRRARRGEIEAAADPE